MNTCDPGIVEIILGFSVAGITLRMVITWLKDKLRVKGFLALGLTFVCCAIAVVVYMALTGWAWMCFLFWTCLVFAGTQTAYRATHK